jgi:hypothetical protein
MVVLPLALRPSHTVAHAPHVRYAVLPTPAAAAAVAFVSKRILLLLSIFLCAGAQAQDGVVIPGESLGVWQDTLDTADPRLRPFVRPETLTLRLDGAVLDTTRYTVDARTGRLVLDPPPPAGAVLTARYRTLPFEGLARAFFLRERVAALDDTTAAPVIRQPGPPADPVFGDMAGLRRRGAIRRGIVTGNRRDVSLESGLRLELEGEIAEGVTLQAVLTDENTPIQPEGTTQRLTDLDRVYIQLDSRHGQARLGDVDLAFSGTAFAPFDRKLQGAALRAEVPAALDGAFAGGSVTVTGAVTRGLFRSQDIQPVEGVQGPYRLRGQRGEELIIVIAGSERVFLDGVLMVRGESGDYVIDYATGEVTFTPRQLITAERRLTVDFEYTTGAFTRTLLATEVDLAFGERVGPAARPLARIRTTVLREADGAAFADELGLTEADLDLIASSGVAPAVRSGAERVPFDAESSFVLYASRDTTLAGQTYQLFVPATPRDAEVFRVRFSRVEPGTGQYARGGRAVNGVVFEWVGPAGGDYVPLRILPKPEMRQLVDVAASLEPLPGLEIFGEVAQSGLDVNRLSDVAATEAGGGAYLAGVRLQSLDVPGGTLRGEVAGRVRGATFRPFERIRPVEFNRQWNIAQAGSGLVGIDSLREETLEGFLEWARPGGSIARLEAGRLALGDLFDGDRLAASVALSEPGLPSVAWRTDWIDARNGLLGEEGAWLRQRGRVGYPLAGGWQPFLEVEQERREQFVLGTDSLAATALAFWEVRPGLAFASGGLVVGGSVGFREEQLPLDGDFADSGTAVTFRTDLRYRAGSAFNTEAEAAYRRRSVTEAFRQRGEGEAESVALRWSTRWSPLARAAELSTVYAASTERTPVLQEVFVRVGPELGEWVWEDLNNDGIQQIDEFRPQNFPLEGEYLRVLLPGDDLTPTAAVQAQLRLRLDPSRLIAPEATGWRRALAEVQSFTTVDLQERTEADDLLAVYMLRPAILQQPGTTLQGRIRLAQELTFFRNQPLYGARLAASHLRTTATLASGVDRRLVQRVEAEAQYQVSPPAGLRLRGLVERSDAANTIASRTFEIRTEEIEPELTYRLTDAVTLTAGTRLARSRDVLGGREAFLVITPLRARIAAAGRLQILVRAERADIALSGPPATGQVYFELTQRRGPGTSYLWNASGQYTINRYLRATLNVEGRAPADAPVFHTLRLQLSALF